MESLHCWRLNCDIIVREFKYLTLERLDLVHSDCSAFSLLSVPLYTPLYAQCAPVSLGGTA
jgi:hypothetical protein